MLARLLILLLLQWRSLSEGTVVDTAIDASGTQSSDGLSTEASTGVTLIDSEGNPINLDSKWTAFDRRCQQAIKKAITEAESTDAEAMPKLYPDPLTGVTVEPRSTPDDVRIVYVVLASRDSAEATVSRLVRALYHPTHLFLVHFDLKANATTHDQLLEFASSRPNVHILKTRRLVQVDFGFLQPNSRFGACHAYVHTAYVCYFTVIQGAQCTGSIQDHAPHLAVGRLHDGPATARCACLLRRSARVRLRNTALRLRPRAQDKRGDGAPVSGWNIGSHGRIDTPPTLPSCPSGLDDAPDSLVAVQLVAVQLVVVHLIAVATSTGN